MTVFIYYEHLTREWTAVQRLKKKLENRGCTVYLFSIIFQVSKAIYVSKKHCPDFILMPWFVDGLHERIIEPIVRRNPNVKIANLHHEEISSPAFESQLYPKTEFTKNGSYHFVWGNYFKERLIEHGVHEEYICVLGNIRNDESFGTSTDKKSLSENYGLNPHKKWILFAENRGWLLQRDSKGTLDELTGRGMEYKDGLATIEYTKSSMEAFFYDMRSLNESFFNEFEFIYRPHPGTRLYDNVPNGIKVIQEKSIYDWISAADLFLTCESTSIFEAELMGCPCATIDCVEEPAQLKMAGVHRYYKLNHLSDISVYKIEEILSYMRDQGKIYEDYLGIVDGCSCDRVADKVAELCRYNSSPNDSMKISKPSRYYQLHQQLFETATYITAKLNILDILKFPESAYTEARDIPFLKANEWIYHIGEGDI